MFFKKTKQVKTKKTGRPLSLRNFLLSFLLCLGLFLLPAIAGNVFGAWYCGVVEEINNAGYLFSWAGGFKLPYSQWLDEEFLIRKKHKLQPGVFTEVAGLKSVIAASSSPGVISGIKGKADNVFNAAMSEDNADLSLSDRANKRGNALRDGTGMAAYETAKKGYELTLNVEKQLKDFSPSRLDVAAVGQVQKDIVKLQQLAMTVKAEAIKVEANETLVRAIVH